MKKKSTKITIILVFIVIFSHFASIAKAIPTQWFPQAGTRVEHKMSSFVKYNNGTLEESSELNVYTTGSSLYLIPKSIDNLMDENPSLTPLINNVEISMFHTYSEGTSTQLNRITSILINGTEYIDNWIHFTRYRTTLSGQYQLFRAQSILVQKFGFSDISLFDFFDYIDNTAGPGTELSIYHKVLFLDKNHIIIQDTFGEELFNYAHIADRTGKVITFVFSCSNPEAESKGVQSFSYILSSDDNSFSIPSFPFEFFILFTGLAIILIVERTIKKRNFH